MTEHTHTQPVSKSKPDLEVNDNESLRHILVVDDETMVVLGLREYLKTLPNCQITVTTDSELALQLFEKQSFDVLITDYQMPNMDGLTLATQVHQLYPQIPIIMLTAHGSAFISKQVDYTFIHCILDKPTRAVKIRNTVLEALEEGDI